MKTAIERSERAELTSLAERYQRIRSFSETLCETLEPEDCCIQSMPDASPIRWHLAHTTWFFETFVLARTRDYTASQTEYAYLFNSYYNAIGKQFPRERRGLLSRPTVEQVWEYRREIDRHMLDLLTNERRNPGIDFAHRRIGFASRATTSGIDANRYQTRAGVQSDVSDLPARTFYPEFAADRWMDAVPGGHLLDWSRRRRLRV